MKRSTSILLALALASMVTIASCRPIGEDNANEEVEVEKRSSNEAGQHVPRYIQDLYDILTKNDGVDTPDPIESKANTIRSLQNVAPEPSCDVFNFSLLGIGTHELAVRAELHLYMLRSETVQSPPTSPFYVVIKKFDSSKDEGSGYITSIEVVPSRKSGWLTFEVQHVLAPLIKNGESNAVFRVQIVQGVSDFNNEDSLSCSNGPVTFVYSSTDEKKAPYLTIQSYDSQVDQMDYSALLNIDSAVQPDQTAAAATRKRRNVQNVQIRLPACQVNELTIATAPVVHQLFGPGQVIPATFNAGMCGGQCSNTHPQHPDNIHSHLVHSHVRSQGFSYNGPFGLNTNFVQSCSPVQYSTLAVIFIPQGKPTKMVRIPNIRITKCDCLEMMKFSRIT